MTADKILARKREVLVMRREELAAQERGEGDNFNLFFLEEELNDLNAQLRSLRGAYRSRGLTNGGLAMDRARHADWLASGGAGEARRAYIDTVRSGDAVLSKRQRELFDLWRGGMSQTEIAARLGLHRSTVSRTLTRAKARLRAEAERRGRAQDQSERGPER